MIFEYIWFQYLFTNKLSLHIILTVFRTSIINLLHLLQDIQTNHEIIAEFSYLSSFYHLFVYHINGWFFSGFVVVEDFFYIFPTYLFCQHFSLFYVENHLFYWNCSFYLRVFNCWLIYQSMIWVVVLHFIEKRTQVNGLISKGVQSWENVFEIFPIILT